MTDNDYVILVDENGTPYIAHGERYQRFKNNLKNSRAVKYLARFPNFYGMGKTAYAYTEQQLRNLRNGGRKAATAVQNTAKKAAKYVDDHDAGLTERIQANRLHRQSLRAGRKGDTNKAAALEREAGRQRIQGRKEYNNSGVKKAADTIEKYGSTSMNAIRGAGSRVGRFIDDHDLGLTEAIEANAARRKKNRAIKTGDTQGIVDYTRQEARLREEGRKERENAVKGVKNAARSATRAAGRFIDDHDLGLTEAAQASRLSRQARQAEKEGKTNLAAQLDREAGRLRAQGRQEREGTADSVKNAGRSAANAARNVGNQVNGQIKNVQNAIDNKLDQIKAGRIAKQHERRLAEIKDYMDDIAEAKQAFENGDPKALRELENAVNSVSDRLGGVQTVLTKSDLNAIEGFLDGIEEYLDRGYDAEDRRGNVH